MEEESDYEPDEEKREKSRELFRKRKEVERSMNCEKCVFRGKTPAVLHVRKKHYVSEAHVHLIFQGAALNYGQLTFCNHIKCNCSSFPSRH